MNNLLFQTASLRLDHDLSESEAHGPEEPEFLARIQKKRAGAGPVIFPFV
jgi:hypothetical protein